MDRPRKIEGGDHCQVVEPDVFAPALIDLERDQSGTMPVGWDRHGLARTTVVAAAILDVAALDPPVFARHFRLPCSTTGPRSRPAQLSCRFAGAIVRDLRPPRQPVSAAGACPR